MLLNPVDFLHKNRLPQNYAKDNKTNIGEIRKPSVIYGKELNKNASIITDKYLESDVVDNVCLKQQHVNATTLNSLNTSTEDMYVNIITCEEKPVLNNATLINVNYHEISDSIRRKSTVQKDCNPESNYSWFRKNTHRMFSNIRNR